MKIVQKEIPVVVRGGRREVGKVRLALEEMVVSENSALQVEMSDFDNCCSVNHLRKMVSNTITNIRSKCGYTDRKYITRRLDEKVFVWRVN